ncbi:MAG TPA: energy transducer TonB [Puia sp.]|nr:energy transducer TonB [Puia sp.]
MRPFYLCFLLFLTATAVASAQERKLITSQSGDRYRRVKEVYFVLRSDNSIKDGPYQQWLNDKLEISGHYKNGQKDSVWEIYNRQILQTRKHYDHGKMVGKWEFYTWQGEPFYTYDFATDKACYPAGPIASDTATHFYLNEAGQWVRGRLDQDIIPLFSPGEWLNFLNRNLKFPDAAVINNEQGRVVISMLVDENGQASDYAVYTSVSRSLDKEALRVVSAHDNLFAPAQKNGKKIRSIYLQPIIFKMEN